MWLPSDVETRPEDRSSWGQLWNLAKWLADRQTPRRAAGLCDSGKSVRYAQRGSSVRLRARAVRQCARSASPTEPFREASYFRA
jgi:hypothetical protein